MIMPQHIDFKIRKRIHLLCFKNIERLILFICIQSFSSFISFNYLTTFEITNIVISFKMSPLYQIFTVFYLGVIHNLFWICFSGNVHLLRKLILSTIFLRLLEGGNEGKFSHRYNQNRTHHYFHREGEIVIDGNVY